MARPATKTKLGLIFHKKAFFLFDAKIKNAILANLFPQNVVEQLTSFLLVNKQPADVAQSAERCSCKA